LPPVSYLPIKVVSNSIGYTSRSAFSRAFRAIYGIDPKTFRVIGDPEEPEAARIEPWVAREDALQTNRS
jgi:AraC-like DNA-binding protein